MVKNKKQKTESSTNVITSIDTINEKSLMPIKISNSNNIVEMSNKYQIQLDIKGKLTDSNGVFYSDDDLKKLKHLFESIELPATYNSYTKHEIGLMLTKLRNYKDFYDMQAKTAAQNVKKLQSGMKAVTKIIDDKISILKKAEDVASAMEIQSRIELLREATFENIQPKMNIEFKHFVMINEVSKAVFNPELLSEVTYSRVRTFNDLIDVVKSRNLLIETPEIPSTIIRVLSRFRWDFERSKKALMDKYQPRLEAMDESGNVVEATQEAVDSKPFYTKVLIRTQDYDKFKTMMNRQGIDFTIIE